MGAKSSKYPDGIKHFRKYKSGDKYYTGNFDVKNGKPILTSDDAQYESPHELYKGSIKDGQPCGYGKHYFKNGNIYEYEYVDSIRKSNYMRVLIHNGDIYEGECLPTAPNKYTRGKMTYANGDIYEGDFDINLTYVKNNYGKMTYVNGDIYEGEWLNDQRSRGKCIWANGDICEGKWFDGKGNGMFTIHIRSSNYLSNLLKITNITMQGIYINNKKEGIFYVTGEEDGKKKEYNCKYNNDILIDYKQID